MSQHRTTRRLSGESNDDPGRLTLSRETRQQAMFMAMVVRNALEDFHAQHLSDDEMRLLNPIIRNAIATALQASLHAGHSPAARLFVEFNTCLIPDYWEEPELLPDFVEVVRRSARR